VQAANKVALVTLGCAKNEADSRHMRESIIASGYELVDKPDCADFIIINTCAFIQEATEESLEVILSMAEMVPARARRPQLLVVGCLPARYGASLKGELPEVALFLTPAEEGDIVDGLRSLASANAESAGEEGVRSLASANAESEPDPELYCGPGPEPKPDGGQGPGADPKFGLEQGTEPGSGRENGLGSGSEYGMQGEQKDTAFQPWAYVKISDGCSRRCSYCTIPQIRGPYQSRPFTAIAAEVSWLIAGGVWEIILIGQDTGIWSEPRDRRPIRAVQANRVAGNVPTDQPPQPIAQPTAPTDQPPQPVHSAGPKNLAQLLEALAQTYPAVWFRVLYLQPQGVSDELLAVMAAHDNICDYLDIPLQHADARILREMGRSGSAAEHLALIARARQQIPDVSVRTTLMAGFPGEDAKAVKTLERFVREAHCDYVGVFVFSPEPDTIAGQRTDQLSQRCRQTRAQRLRDLADSISVQRMADKVGQVIEVMVCGVDEDGMFGRSQAQAPDVDGVVYINWPVKNTQSPVSAALLAPFPEATTADTLVGNLPVDITVSSGAEHPAGTERGSRFAPTTRIPIDLGSRLNVRIYASAGYDLFGELMV
jgi:ribosomal protein S12 methylthiotransferase